MKTLLYKQLRLVCQPMTLVFCLFGVMLLIPAYPYTVMWFYVMLGLFFSFLNGREQKDVYYSALLPIRKRDTVKANCLFVGLIELLALVIAIPFALLRAKLGIGDNPVGLNANVTLFACGLMLFAVFNAVFLLSFYRTAYKVGVSFVKACIVMAVAAIIMEAAVHFPALSRFNGYDLACQLPLLAAIVIRCIVVARNAKSQLDAYICVGVAGMLVFQIVSNVGMCLFVLPVVGLTLPFISYGGSSVVTLFIAMGMVSGIQKRSLPDWLR